MGVLLETWEDTGWGLYVLVEAGEAAGFEIEKAGEVEAYNALSNARLELIFKPRPGEED